MIKNFIKKPGFPDSMVNRNPSGEVPLQESSMDVGKRADIPSDTVIETKHLFSDPTINYHLIEEIGGGSEGTVYKAVAEDSSGSKRVVAFKEFHNQPDDEQRRHLEREMQLRQQLTGVPGVASYITHGYTAGRKLRFALVSEYIEGTTLEHIVQPGNNVAGKQFTEEEAKNFLYQALTCVGEFHKRFSRRTRRCANWIGLLCKPWKISAIRIIDYSWQSRIQKSYSHYRMVSTYWMEMG